MKKLQIIPYSREFVKIFEETKKKILGLLTCIQKNTPKRKGNI